MAEPSPPPQHPRDESPDPSPDPSLGGPEEPRAGAPEDLIGAAARAVGSAADATLKAAGTAADATFRAAGTAADATLKAAGTVADATLKTANVAADVTFSAATVAAEATIQSATWTARLLAWLLARMPMRQIIWLGASLAVLLLALIGLAIWVFGWLWNPQVNLERWREQAQQNLSVAVGRTVTIADMRVTVGKSPELRVRGLTIANAPGFSAAPLLRVDEAVLKVTGEVSDFTRAVSDARLVVQQATLSGVNLSLENRAQGNNWTLGPPGQKNRTQRESFLAALPLQALARLVVDEARIDRLNVTLVDLRGQTSTWVLPQAVLTAGADAAMQFNAQGERCAKGQACRISVTAGSLADLARVDSGALTDWPLNLTVGWGDRIAAFSGALRLRSMAGIVAAAAPRIEQDLADAGVRLRGPLSAGIGADFELTAQSMRIKGLTATFGQALLTGDWQADWALDVDARPSVKADLDITGLDEVLESALPPRATSTQARQAVQAQAPREGGGLRRFYEGLAAFEIDPALLTRADAQMRLRMQSFDALGVQATGSQATVTLVAGQFWAPMKTTLWGAPFSAELQVDATQKPPTLQADLLSRNAALGPLARGALGLPALDGRTGQLKLVLATQGDTLAQWLRALDLRVDLTDTQARYGVPGTTTAAPLAGGTATHTTTPPATTRPVTVDVRALSLRLPSLRPLTGTLDAQLLGRPLQATLSGSTLEQIMRADRSSLGLAVRSAEMTLDLQARIAAPLSPHDDELDIRLEAPRAAALASWLGLDPGARQAQAPLKLSASVRRTRGGGTPQAPGAAAASGLGAGLSLTQPLVLSLGRTELRLRAQPRVADGRDIIDIDLDIPRLVTADLDALLPRRNPPASPAREAPRAAGLALDIPVLPQRIALADADVALHLGEVEGAPLDLRAIEWKGRIRDGHMQAAPLSLTLEGKPVQGAISLDLRSDEPQAGLWLSAQQPDIGHLLRRLGLRTDTRLRFDAISVHLMARSARLGDMLARSSLSAAVSGGQLLLADPALGRDRVIDLSQGTMSAGPGGPLTLSLGGRVDGQTIALTLRSGSLSQLADTRAPVTLSLRADLPQQVQAAASTTSTTASMAPWVEVGAVFARELQAPRGELSLRAGGGRLDALNAVTGLNLPPWGPWTLAGQLDVAPGRYELRGARMTVGGSVLAGSASLALPGTQTAAPRPAVPRPRLELTLRAPRLQLDDFPTTGWSAVGSSRPGTATGPTLATTPASTSATTPDAGTGTDALTRLRAQARRGTQAGEALLAAGTLDRYDAMLDLAVDSALAGTNVLGGGRMTLRLREGDLRLDPVRLDLPGGTARLSLAFTKAPAAGAIAQAPPAAGAPAQAPPARRAELQVDIPELDYSVIASRLPRAEGAAPPRGSLRLRLQATADTPELDQLLERGSGQVDLTLWPRDMRSDRMDIWVNNLFTSLLTVVDASSAPQVNCAVVRARLEQGQIRPQSLLLDTSAMRVSGKGSVNLLSGQYALRFEPRSKQAQFFSLATPVDVTGPLDAPKVVLNSGDIAQTALRLATSILWVPLMKLAGQTLPADGSDVCGRPAAAVGR